MIEKSRKNTNLFYNIIAVHYLIGLAAPPRIHLILINADAADLGGAKIM